MALLRGTLHHDFVNMTSSGFSFVFIIAGIQISDPRGRMICLGIGGTLSFISWIANVLRYRLVSDTPTSRIASASQGYTELFGRAAAFPNELPLGKRSGLPCVWFRCITEREGDNGWERVADEISDSTFLLQDSSGSCVIDPDGAEVVSTHKRVWNDNGYRLTEWSLRPGEPLYGIGELATEGGASAALNVRDDINAVLTEWKRDKAGLLARFDADKNGEIDLGEWEAARKAAQAEVEKQHREIRLQEGVHIMRRPKAGRLFLLSNLSPRALAKRYLVWGWAHLGFFMIALTAVLYLVTSRYPVFF